MSAEVKRSRWDWPVAILLGLAVGLGSAWWVMAKAGARGFENRGWAGSTLAGSTGADPWTRAQIAVRGILALNKSQAIYLTTHIDSSGGALRADCRYRVSGEAMPGRWWSVTVYAADNYLPMNDDDALSFDATEVKPDASGQWTAELASKQMGKGAWASTRNAGNYDVTLRVYNPTPEAQADFGKIPIPTITRLDCGDAA